MSSFIKGSMRFSIFLPCHILIDIVEVCLMESEEVYTEGSVCEAEKWSLLLKTMWPKFSPVL